MTHMIDVAGHALAIHDTGPADAPCVMLLHSLGTSHRVWDPIVPALTAAGFRVLCPDMRGHGQTAATPGPYSIDLLAHDALAVLQQLDIHRVAIVGLSIGGLIAQELAHLAPNRVSALVLMDTALAIPPANLWSERATTVRTKGMAALVDGILVRWVTPAAAPHAVELLRHMILATEPEGYAACCEAIGKADFHSQSASLAVPTLVIVGADDPSTPVASAEALRDTIPGARLEIIPNASHIPTAEQPAAIAGALLRFLQPDAHGAGMRTRRRVLGDAHVDRAIAGITDLDRDFQRFITEGAWGSVWTRPHFDHRTRSIVTLTLLAGLGHEEEFKLHLRATRNTGASAEDIAELLMHVAVYAGVPAANSAMRLAKQVLAEI